VGETAADTARELGALRAESDRLLDALERQAQRSLEVPRQLAASPALVPVVGTIAGLTVLLLWYRSWRRAVRARRAAAERRRAEAWAQALGIPETLASPAAGPADTTRATADEPGLLQRTLGAVAASAVLAGVDLLARRLSQQRSASIQREPPAAEPTASARGPEAP
jgi:hypothetical protein